MIPGSFDAIDKAGLEALKENGVREGRSIEYKQELPKSSEGEKKEFLADVSAFANGAGGDMIYGVVELRDSGPTGLIDSIPGLAGINPDLEMRRLESMIQASIEPRISGLQIKPVEGFDQGPVLVLRIPKSYAAPHMVRTGDSRFYSRNNAGKYPLDVTQIRAAFSGSEMLPERIRRFRDERIARIIADETPVVLPQHPKAVLHLLPYNAFSQQAVANLAAIYGKAYEFKPMNRHSWFDIRQRYNLDGLLFYGSNNSKDKAVNYLQVFRSGAIEVVSSEMVTNPEAPPGYELQISPSVFERELIGSLHSYMRMMANLGTSLPTTVALTLIGVKGFRFIFSNIPGDLTYDAIDRDVLFLPETTIVDPEIKADQILQPILDAMWQSAGRDQDLHYTYGNDGRWREKPGNPPLT